MIMNNAFIKDEYRTETNKDVWSEELLNNPSGSYSDDYVKWLENKVKNLNIDFVSQQRELLTEAFDLINIHDGDREKINKLVDITLKSINCG